MLIETMGDRYAIMETNAFYRHFRVVVTESSIWDKKHELQIRIPYKNIFGLSRVKWVEVGYVPFCLLSIHNLKTELDILIYLLREFIDDRKKTYCERRDKRVNKNK